jgi:hypothetical protein
MAERHIARTDVVKLSGAEDFGNKSVAFIVGKHSVVVHGYSAGFLAPVLKGVKPDIYNTREVRYPAVKYSEYSAFFMN